MGLLASMDVNLDLDVNMSNVTIDSVHVNQFEDKARNITCHIYNDGVSYSIPSDANVRIRMQRSDGSGSWLRLKDLEATISSDRQSITIPVKATTGLTEVAGRTSIQFEIESSGEKIFSNYFYINVHKTLIQDSDVKGSSIFTVLEQYIQLAKSWAVGNTGVRDGENSDNAKYYSQQASSSASKAASSLSNIETYKEQAKGYADDASRYATVAAEDVGKAKDYRDQAKVWAVGTGTTATPSDTNNSHYWAEQSRIYMDAKADKTTVNGCIKDITLDEATGVFTIKFVNNTTKTIDTTLEKIATNFQYDEVNEKLILYDPDGRKVGECDLSALITQYDFVNSPTISATVVEDGKNKKLKFNLVEGSLDDKYLDPTYFAGIKQATKDTKDNADLAKSYAVGGTGTRAGEDEDNAEYYYRQAKAASDTTNLTYVKLGELVPEMKKGNTLIEQYE